MVFGIIGALVGLVLGWLIVDHKSDLADCVFGVAFSVVMAVLGFAIGIGISFGVGAALPKEYVMDRQIELVTIQDTSGIQGSFFLGTGHIESKSYYVFYQKEGNGVRFGKVSAEKAVVYEEERNGGLIKTYTRQFTSGWHNAFGTTLGGEKYEIFIPQGSILHEFQLDLK